MATNKGIKEISLGTNDSYLIEPTLYTKVNQTSAATTFTADLDKFELFNGVTIAVKFGVTNNANATLNINGTGAKAIYYEGAAITASKLKAKHTYVFTYNGTQWELVGDLDTDTNTHRPIQVNGTQILANNTTALNLKNGDNVSITNNGGAVTIAATDTTYTFENGTNGFKVTPLGGTAQTVTVTPSITNNITGTGTPNYLTKFTGANTIGATGITIDSNNNLTIPSTLIKFTALGEGLELSQNNDYFGTNYDARIISIVDTNPNAGSTAVDGGLIVQAVGRVSGTDTIQELLRIRNHNGSADWKTGEFQWKTKDIVVEVGKANKTWDISIAGDAATVNGLTVQTAVPVNAVFTDTNKYHKSGSWSDLTYTATAVNNADELKFTIPDNYGDTKNPYASKTKNYVLAAPNGSAGVPSFRALVAADIPALAYVPATSGANDVNTLVNTGIYNITSGSATNTPKNYGYGNLITLDYRKHSGNTTTDWASQIYLHSGSNNGAASATAPGNVLYYRTSNASSWLDWQQVVHTAASYTKVGDTNKPVYIAEDGTATAITAVGASYGGTGKTTLNDSANVLINALGTGSSPLTANDYVITQYVGGGTTTTTYHRRPASLVVNSTLVKSALGTVSTTAKKFLKDTGDWVQVAYTDLTGVPTSFTPAEHNHNTLYPLKTSTTITNGKATKLTFTGEFQCTIGVTTSNSHARAYYKISGYGQSDVRITVFELADSPQVKYYIPDDEEAIVFCNQHANNVQTLFIVMDYGALPTITTDLTIPSSPNYLNHHILTEDNYKSYVWARPSSITTDQVLVSSGTAGETTLRGIRNNTSAGALGWTANTTDITLITTNTLAYWNGRYNNSNSNLEYYKGGAFGTMAKETATDYAKLASPTFTGTPKAPTAADGTSTTQIATTAFVMSQFKYNDAMIYKGVVNANADLPATHYQGWTYKVATAGTYAGIVCEIGDMIICNTDGTSANNAHWNVIQTNIDGAVIGPTAVSSGRDNSIVRFDGETGKLIQGSKANLDDNGNFLIANDASIKFYRQTNTTYGSESYAIQTCFDDQDPATSAYTTTYENRCNLLLQPRGGQVYIGTDLTSTGDTNYSLYVTGDTYLKNKLIVHGLEIKGHITGDAGTTGHGLYSGGGYHNAYNNIILHGDSSTGSSGIAFISDKIGENDTVTTINQPSDRAFIQYHACGVTTPTAENTAPTIATSGEKGIFVIGIGNDGTGSSQDQLWLQTNDHLTLIHQIAANSYVIPDTGNTTGSVGNATQPVYIDAGVIKACTTYANASVNYATSAGGVAWANVSGKPIEFGTYSGALNTNGWKTLGGRSSGSKIYISYNNNPATWNSETYSASMVFGCNDTKGLIDIGYNNPIVTFGGSSATGGTDNDPKWYFKLSATSGKTYTFPTTSKTLAAADGSNASGTGWAISITGSSASCTGNAATATAIETAGTTAQFYRGDNSWSNTIKQTSNSTLGIDSNLKIGAARKDLNFDIGNGSGTGINDGYAGGITWGQGTSAYAGIYYQSSGSYGTRLILATTNLYADGSKARMIITSDGKVGIGTLTPSYALSVNGDISATNFRGALIGNADTATRINGNLGVLTDTSQHNIWVSSTNAVDGIPKYISGVYVTASTGIITANGFSGPLSGNATSATILTCPSITTEADIGDGTRTYQGSGAGWTGSVTSMQYAGILQICGGYSRGWQIWAQRGDNATQSLHWRNPNGAATAWNEERIILDSGNYTSYAVAKTAGVTAVTWDATNKKLTRTINGTAADVMTAAQMSTALGLGTFATKSSLAWNEITQSGADSLGEGGSDLTDNSEILTSYASNNGFADTNAKGVVYRRDAIHVYNYIKGKTDSVYAPKSTVSCTTANVKSALGTVSTTAKKFLKDTGEWAQVAWGDLSGVPSSFTPSSHTHYYLTTIGDTRSTATAPNDYNNKLSFIGLKGTATINSPSSDTYSYVVGLRGWSDSSGGDSHEFAFNNSGINWRHGATTSWSAWTKLLDSNNYSSYALPLSGGTMTGQIVLASTGYKTSNVAGYSVDQYGNFKHQRATTTDTFEIYKNDGTITYKFGYETGEVTAVKYVIDAKVRLEYNSTDDSLDFVFI